MATQESNRGADYRSLVTISDRLGRLERSRVDRGDRKFILLQSSAPAAPNSLKSIFKLVDAARKLHRKTQFST